MSGTAQLVVAKLADLKDGDEADCFAVLAKRVRGMTKKDEPYFTCQFRDKLVTRDAPIWSDNRFFQQAAGWTEGMAYRLHVRVQQHAKYGLQLTLLDVRLATEADAADGYNFNELVESSHRPVGEMWQSLNEIIHRYLTDPKVQALVRDLLETHRELFERMPAAANFHHSYTAGLLEHVCSMARIGGLLADHYAKYYTRLNPPLNKSVVVAAAILHDIGKLRELKYHPVEAKYTKEGSLIGHVLMGRDMVREAAQRISDFPEETLLLLEHAILSHHGKKEFGAPVLPQTIEALIISFVDDLDAKVNVVARGLLKADGDDEFTDKLYPLDNRRIYRGVPVEPADGDGYV